MSYQLANIVAYCLTRYRWNYSVYSDFLTWRRIRKKRHHANRFNPFLLVAASIALVAAIEAPPTTARRAVYVRGADALGPTPAPRPCGGALRTLLDANFDSLSPPALPPGWLATNALGPPPFGVTSDSGVPRRLRIHHRTQLLLMIQM